MFDGKKVSLVFPALNEAENIAKAVKEFKSIAVFDEILVVDNNSSDNTATLAQKAGAKVVRETRQGYGFALRRGMEKTTGDYIILSEPDGTFSPSDTPRLLMHIKNYDMVTGTRTNPMYFTKDANMSPFLRFGNIAVAKLIQLLYKTNSLSDCGCTFRALRRSLVKKLLPAFTVGGQHFLAELVVLTTLSGGKIIEIPVHYQKRIGHSKITGSFKTSVTVGLRMLLVLLKYTLLSKSKA